MTNDPTEPVASVSPPKLLSYFRLVRLPNVFTAVADVAMGFFFVNGANSFDHLGVLACLVAASCCLYMAGMVLNDVFDYKVDAEQRPFRPLPAGEIPLGWARCLGCLLLGAGIAMAIAAGLVGKDAHSHHLRPGAIGLMLAACILLYDGVLKKTPVAPVFMGGCRFFNVLLGMSVVMPSAATAAPLVMFDLSEFIVAGGIGIYIVGLTWFARHETEESQPATLVVAVAVMITGVGLLAFYPSFGLGSQRVVFPEKVDIWQLVLLMVAVVIVRRSFSVVLRPTPNKVQNAVKQGLFSLIVLDATVSLLAAGPLFGVVVMALMLPTIVLGMWVYST